MQQVLYVEPNAQLQALAKVRRAAHDAAWGPGFGACVSAGLGLGRTGNPAPRCLNCILDLQELNCGGCAITGRLGERALG